MGNIRGCCPPSKGDHRGCFFFYFLFQILLLQPATSQVAYSKDFQFKEGLYLDFQQFRSNQPVPKSRIVSDYDKNDLAFFDQLFSKKNTNIKYLGSSGVEQTVASSGLWGYSKNNGIYINYDGVFYRMGVIGSLCHFVANVTSYVYAPDPFYGMRYGTTSVPVKELKQFILETGTGRLHNFNIESMEYLLKEDVDLYNEFMALKRRKKKDAIFIYLRRYNEKHPLYFPGN